jgi:hypothetical protein
LVRRPERLAVLKVTGVRWNDLGEPKRVLASLDMEGIRPPWAEAAAPQVNLGYSPNQNPNSKLLLCRRLLGIS